VLLTGTLQQGVEQVVAGAAVPAGPADALDLGGGAGAAGDDGLDGPVGDRAAQADDHGRALRAAAGSIIRVAFRFPLGRSYNED
jgi:hypothetical protein